MGCYECIRAEAEVKRQKLEALKPKFNAEAKSKGLAAYAAVETVNSSPGWMFKPIGDEAIERAAEQHRAVEYLLVY
jgi:hypothetical protein